MFKYKLSFLVVNLFRFIVTLLFVCSNSFAGVDDKERCLQIGNELASAYQTEDVQALERTAKWAVSHCKLYQARKNYYDNYSSLAEAHSEQGRHSEALAWVQKCINENFGHVSCHVNEAVELLLLGRFLEANKAKYKALKLIEVHLKDSNLDPDEAELYRSERNMLNRFFDEK